MSVFRSLLALSAEGGQNYYGDFGSVYTRLEYLEFTGTQYLNTRCALFAAYPFQQRPFQP